MDFQYFHITVSIICKELGRYLITKTAYQDTYRNFTSLNGKITNIIRKSHCL